MSKNLAIPYLFQLKSGVNAIHLTEVANINTLNNVYLPNYSKAVEQICLQSFPQIEEQNACRNMTLKNNAKNQMNYVYEIVHPDDLDLKPINNLKKGRPKKKDVEVKVIDPLPKVIKPTIPKMPVPRTRSGRIVKFPKYIEKDFEKVDTEEACNNIDEVKTTGFTKSDDNLVKKCEEKPLLFHQRKRKISAQYRCPKCNKAYLGKMKMMQHIKKYPDHGPIPVPQNQLNFDVWNYLVDITQKCPPARRGIKFCEELTNLLHNVLLLTSALFKKVEINKNYVEVDKVLGNAIGLPPGLYKFNDAELYKDVTVLKLITNTDFFKPVDADPKKFHVDATVGVDIKKSESVYDKNVTNSENDTVNFINQLNNVDKTLEVSFSPCQDFCMKKVESKLHNAKKYKTDRSQLSITSSSSQNSTINNIQQPVSVSIHKDLLEESNKKITPEDRLELLSENSLLQLPLLRNTVEELMLPNVDSGGALLDNSTSSDEAMNVDQFVNERFKKITEPEIEINTNSLNLDLPTLDLFNFHTS